MKKLIVLAIAAMVTVTPMVPAHALQCVSYAREASGINLKGDAWQWWSAAQGVYDRGRTPKEGAVMVFNRQGSMRHGHVSVITKVVDKRTVLVNHANWAPAHTLGRGEVTEAVPVMDVSAANDWSQVRVWHRPGQDFGNRVYKTEGFVYRDGKSPIHTFTPGIATVAVNLDKLDRHATPAQAEEPAAPAPIPAIAQPAPRPEPTKTAEPVKAAEAPKAAPAHAKPVEARAESAKPAAEPTTTGHKLTAQDLAEQS